MSVAVVGSPHLSMPFGCLPPRLRMLFVRGAEEAPGWLTEALSLDRACEVHIDEVVGGSAGAARLRDDLFDAVLVSHLPPELDALEFVEAVRGGGGDDQTVVVLGSLADTEMLPLCCEAGADAYVWTSTAGTRSLIWTIARAVERRRLIGENRRWESSEAQRREREQNEARRTLDQQRAMLGSSTDGAGHRGEPFTPPPELVEHYREFLRGYVMMGSGGLPREVERLIDRLSLAGVAPRDALDLHVRVLDEMIQGLGNRSARHVMSRANTLVLELSLQLAERYRRLYLHVARPPRQLLLPEIADSLR